jgi:hypothetical protein
VRRAHLIAALALFAPLACTTTSTDQHNFLPPPASGGAPGQLPPSGTVKVTINTPADSTVLGASVTVPVNSDLMVTATAIVDGGTDFIDTSSVKMTLTVAGSTAAASMGQLVSSGGGAYAGTLSLGNRASGTYILTVSATSQSGMTATAQIQIVVDSGPIITITSPLPDHAYKGTMAIEIVADPGAFPPLTSLVANISGTTINLVQQGTSNTYRATVAFGLLTPPPPPDVQVLPPLSGKQLLDVKASNAHGVQADAQVIFEVDLFGPTITATNPFPGDIVGGVIQIQATVTDDSGILDSSVVAVISNAETPIFELSLTPQGSGIYGTLFDTGNLTRCPEPSPPPPTPPTDPANQCVVFPTISFRAVDLVGNQAVVTYGFAIDNIAPVADLDPPLVRHRKLTPTGYACSWLFDPLSLNQEIGDMPNDGCMVPQVFDLRARIEDDGNRASMVKVTPLSLVDPDNTSVFILPASVNQPLVVDSDNDGRCDEINPLLLQTSPSLPPTPPSGILQVRLAPVPLQGSGNFEPDASIALDNPPAPCGEGDATAPPPRLCDSFLQPTIAISYYDSQPSIWSVEPIDTVFHCLGNQLDTKANGIPEGWACIAVQTRDLAGNQSTSVPMRVYIQYGTVGGFCPQPPASAGPPPNCAGTYDPMAKTAAFGTCYSRSFPRNIEYYCAPGGC